MVKTCKNRDLKPIFKRILGIFQACNSHKSKEIAIILYNAERYDDTKIK